MLLTEAVQIRIDKICDKYNIKSRRKLENQGLIAHSTIANFMNKPKTSDVYLRTIFMVCRGAGITLQEFFNDEIFDDIQLPEDFK